jgi:uncharacterized membrane protein SpoIIM required for sporulation
MSSEAGLAHWLNNRKGAWQALSQNTLKLQRGRKHRTEDALAAVEGYRSLGRDLSIARRVLPGSRVTLSLEALYARLHAAIYRAPHNWGASLRTLFRDEIPQVAADLQRYIWWVTSLFILTCGAGWWLISTFPELIGLVASEQMIAGVENGHLWTEGILNITPSSVLSVQILANNIMVSLAALCLGLFFGLGTFYIIALNGFMLGSVFAFTQQHGLAGDLLKFIVAHGLVELSVICVSGAAGMALGAALAIPTQTTRRESFRQATAQVSRLIVLCALLLVGCGFIEGFVSPNDTFSMASRVVIGVGYWLIMVTALTGHLFRRL